MDRDLIEWIVRTEGPYERLEELSPADDHPLGDLLNQFKKAAGTEIRLYETMQGKPKSFALTAPGSKIVVHSARYFDYIIGLRGILLDTAARGNLKEKAAESACLYILAEMYLRSGDWDLATTAFYRSQTCTGYIHPIWQSSTSLLECSGSQYGDETLGLLFCITHELAHFFEQDLAELLPHNFFNDESLTAWISKRLSESDFPQQIKDTMAYSIHSPATKQFRISFEAVRREAICDVGSAYLLFDILVRRSESNLDLVSILLEIYIQVRLREMITTCEVAVEYSSINKRGQFNTPFNNLDLLGHKISSKVSGDYIASLLIAMLDEARKGTSPLIKMDASVSYDQIKDNILGAVSQVDKVYRELDRGLENALTIAFKSPLLEGPSSLLKRGDLLLGIDSFCGLADFVGAQSPEIDALKKFASRDFDDEGRVANTPLNDYFYYSIVLPGLDRAVPATIPLAQNLLVGFIFRSQGETFRNFGTFLRNQYKAEIQISRCSEKSSSDKRMVRFILQEYRQSSRPARMVMEDEGNAQQVIQSLIASIQ